MARPRTLSDEQRRLRGSFEASRSLARGASGRTALTQVLEPPDDLDADARREWAWHMPQVVAAGTIAAVNLVSFRALCETSALRRRAYRRARRESPVVQSERGSKVSPAWTAFNGVDAAYRQWAAAFGLTPKAATGLPQLPVPPGHKLEAV